MSKRGATMPTLTTIMDTLLGPEGCPWDKEQTLLSLRPYLIEEAYEVVEAIDADEPEPLREELGDLLFQVVFQAALAERKGWFDFDGVVEAISDKMVRRHPWVFGDEKQHDAAGSLARWEAMKAIEKKDRGALGGVPAAMPALLRAVRVGEKAAAVGYDWPDPEGPRAKVDEELSELDAAIQNGDLDAAEDELGDVLFALANFARKSSLDPEASLRRSLDKFGQRFRHAELNAGEGGLSARSSAELDALWADAKAAHSRSQVNDDTV